MSAGREPSSSSEPSGVDLDSVSASDGDSKYDFEMKSRAAKRSRLDAAAVALGLEHHASAPAATAIASIDHAEEAEARLLQLEVAELLAEVRPDHAAEGPLVELLGRLAETLAALPEADIDPSPVTGLLGDLRFMSKVSSRLSGRQLHGSKLGMAAAAAWLLPLPRLLAAPSAAQQCAPLAHPCPPCPPAEALPFPPAGACTGGGQLCRVCHLRPGTHSGPCAAAAARQPGPQGPAEPPLACQACPVLGAPGPHTQTRSRNYDRGLGVICR